MSASYPIMDKPWYPFRHILELTDEGNTYENALVVACAVGSYLIEHPPTSFNRTNYKSEVPNIKISDLTPQQIYAGLMTPVSRRDLSLGPVIRLNDIKNLTGTAKIRMNNVLSDIYVALSALMTGINIYKAGEKDFKNPYLRCQLSGEFKVSLQTSESKVSMQKSQDVKILGIANRRCSTLGGALNFEGKELYGKPGILKKWDSLSRIKEIADKISNKAVPAPTGSSNSSASATSASSSETTAPPPVSTASASSSETEPPSTLSTVAAAAASASSSETKESTSSVAASSSKPEESTSSGASNSSSSTLSSSTASSSNPVRTTRAFNSTASDLEVPESLKEGDYNIIDISNDGWCLYNTYLTPFSLAGSENARKLACIVADRFSKMPDFDKQFDDYGWNVKIGGQDASDEHDKQIKGFPSQDIPKSTNARYINVNGIRRKVINKKNFIESITTLRNPGKINDGPVLWPDDFWFVILSTLFTNISIIIYVRDKDTNQLNIDRRYATVKDPEDTKDPPNFNIFIQSNGNHFNIIEPSGGQLKRFVNSSKSSWALRQSILDNTFRDSTCGSKAKGDDDFARALSSRESNSASSGSNSSAYEAEGKVGSSSTTGEGKEEYRSSSIREESKGGKESKEEGALNVVPLMDSLGQIGDALTEIEMIMKELFTIITDKPLTSDRIEDARLQYNAINGFLLPNIIMRITVIDVTADNRNEILGFQTRLQHIYNLLSLDAIPPNKDIQAVFPAEEGDRIVRPPLIPVFVVPEEAGGGGNSSASGEGGRRVRPRQSLSFLVPEEAGGGGGGNVVAEEEASSENVAVEEEAGEDELGDIDDAINEIEVQRDQLLEMIVDPGLDIISYIRYSVNTLYNIINVISLPYVIHNLQPIQVTDENRAQVVSFHDRLQGIYESLTLDEGVEHNRFVETVFPEGMAGILRPPQIPNFLNPPVVDPAAAVESALEHVSKIIATIEKMERDLFVIITDHEDQPFSAADLDRESANLIYNAINKYFLPLVIQLIQKIQITDDTIPEIMDFQINLQRIYSSLSLDEDIEHKNAIIEAVFPEGMEGITRPPRIPNFVLHAVGLLDVLDTIEQEILRAEERAIVLIYIIDSADELAHRREEAESFYNIINEFLLPSIIRQLEVIEVRDNNMDRIRDFKVRLDTMYELLNVEATNISNAFPIDMEGVTRPPLIPDFLLDNINGQINVIKGDQVNISSNIATTADLGPYRIMYNRLTEELLPNVTDQIRAIPVTDINRILIRGFQYRLLAIYEILNLEYNMLGGEEEGMVRLPQFQPFVDLPAADPAAEIADLTAAITDIYERKDVLFAFIDGIQEGVEERVELTAERREHAKEMYNHINRDLLPPIIAHAEYISRTGLQGEDETRFDDLIQTRLIPIIDILSYASQVFTAFEEIEGVIPPPILFENRDIGEALINAIPDGANPAAAQAERARVIASIITSRLNAIEAGITEIYESKDALVAFITAEELIDERMDSAIEMYNHINRDLLPPVISRVRAIDLTGLQRAMQGADVLRLANLVQTRLLPVIDFLNYAPVFDVFRWEATVIPPPILNPDRNIETALIHAIPDGADPAAAQATRQRILERIRAAALGGGRAGISGTLARAPGTGGSILNTLAGLLRAPGTGGGAHGFLGGLFGGIRGFLGGLVAVPPPGAGGGAGGGGTGGRAGPSILDPITRLLAAPPPPHLPRADANTLRHIADQVDPITRAAGNGTTPAILARSAGAADPAPEEFNLDPDDAF